MLQRFAPPILRWHPHASHPTRKAFLVNLAHDDFPLIVIVVIGGTAKILEVIGFVIGLGCLLVNGLGVRNRKIFQVSGCRVLALSV